MSLTIERTNLVTVGVPPTIMVNLYVGMMCFDVSFMISHDSIALCAYVYMYGRTNRLLSLASDPYWKDDDQSSITSSTYSRVTKINRQELKRQSQSLVKVQSKEDNYSQDWSRQEEFKVRAPRVNPPGRPPEAGDHPPYTHGLFDYNGQKCAGDQRSTARSRRPPVNSTSVNV